VTAVTSGGDTFATDFAFRIGPDAFRFVLIALCLASNCAAVGDGRAAARAGPPLFFPPTLTRPARDFSTFTFGLETLRPFGFDGMVTSLRLYEIGEDAEARWLSRRSSFYRDDVYEDEEPRFLLNLGYAEFHPLRT
jgi:hypothetical protein